VELPFEFALPGSLPPSFIFAGSEVQARVLYTIQVVGKQAGLGKDRHIVKSFTVFPAPSPAQLAVRRKMQSGWMNPGGRSRRERRSRAGSLEGMRTSMPRLDSSFSDEARLGLTLSPLLTRSLNCPTSPAFPGRRQSL
jgi:hypothetical protein